jgi:hypothetical protein
MQFEFIRAERARSHFYLVSHIPCAMILQRLSVAPNLIDGTKFSLERLPSREELAAGQEIGLAQPYVNEIPPSGNLDSCITHETGTIDPSAC